jgi:LuxR family maltose regulon positive regulatory protein
MTTSTPSLSHPPHILRTKLLPPRLHGNTILRTPLLTRLTADGGSKAMVVVAPAGFGKTTLVNQWIRKTMPARTVAWLSLEEDDNEAERFWRYVIAAWQMIDPAIGRAAVEILDAPLPMPFAPTPIQPAVALLLNDLATRTEPAVVIVDDYHAITDEAIHRSLTFFLEQLPDPCRMVVIARHAPPLSLARLRAHGSLTELHADTLRFTLAETEQFLAQTVPFPIDHDVIQRLWERTEGWAVGLRLATLALQNGTKPIHHVLDTFNGSQPEIMDYLVGEVLQAQPAGLQQFLLATSLLGSVNGGLCVAITGHEDSGAILAELARRNFFLQPYGNEAGWYRYHALFSEAMHHEAQKRFGAEGVHPYFLKASHWYEQHEMREEAIDTALAAREWQRAIALIEPLVAGQHLNDPNDPHRIREWLEQLPPGLLHQRPLLCFSLAIVLIRTLGPRHPDGMKQGTVLVQYAEAGWRREGNHARLGEVYAAHMLHAMWSGDMENASRWAKEAVARLPVNDTVWRGLCLGFVGRSQLRAGKLHDARRTLMEAKAGSEAINNNYATRAHLLMLAWVAYAQGELTLAEAFYQEALPSAEKDGDLSDQAPLHLGLARVAYERNEVGLARQEAESVLAIATRIEAVSWQVGAELLLARLESIEHDPSAAQQRLARLLVQVSSHRHPDLYREVLAAQAELALRMGNLEAVRRWAATVQEVEAPLTQGATEHETLLVVRLRLAEGKYQGALRLLDGMAERATTDGRIRAALEVQLLTALAQFGQGEREQAIGILRALLPRTHIMGLCRFYLEEGTPVVDLLRATVPTVTDPTVRAYAQSLLQAFVIAHHATAHAPLLSAQEQRVLELLATRQSYQEMAQAQIVSVNTIKTQLRHIYRKLGATSRRDAIEIARRLGLIS